MTFQHVEQDGFLAGVVVIDVRLRDIAGLCNLRHGSATVAFFCKELRSFAQYDCPFVPVIQCDCACHDDRLSVAGK